MTIWLSKAHWHRVTVLAKSQNRRFRVQFGLDISAPSSRPSSSLSRSRYVDPSSVSETRKKATMTMTNVMTWKTWCDCGGVQFSTFRNGSSSVRSIGSIGHFKVSISESVIMICSRFVFVRASSKRYRLLPFTDIRLNCVLRLLVVRWQNNKRKVLYNEFGFDEGRYYNV